MEIRRRKYQAVWNLHGGTTSLIFSLTSGARARIGQEGFRKSWAYQIRIPPSSLVWGRNHLHTVEHQLTLLRWSGIPFPNVPPGRLHIDTMARVRVLKRLKEATIESRGFLLIHPTATLFTKQWPEEKFAALADHLSGKHELPVIFTAGKSETQVLMNVARRSGLEHHYWADLSLEELFALIAECLLFIGNDSGPTHAASALGRPVCAVWGSSNFHTWHPWLTDYEMVRSELPCMPCPGYTCHAFGKPRCILEIAVDSVAQACDRILARTRAATQF